MRSPASGAAPGRERGRAGPQSPGARRTSYRCSLPGLAGFGCPHVARGFWAGSVCLFPISPCAALAERVGFEPTVHLLGGHTISSRAPSAARSPLLNRRIGERGIRTPGTVAGTPDFESGAFDQLGQLSAGGSNRFPPSSQARSPSPSGLEELPEQRGALAGPHPPFHGEAVVEAGVGREIQQRPHRAGLGVARPV